MSLTFTPPELPPDNGRALFISASIPNRDRWSGEFDPLAITDAVVALARAFLTAGWRIASAAHPTIAPLLLSAAYEHSLQGQERVIVYQSRLYEALLPAETRRFDDEDVGRFVWTDAVQGDRPAAGEDARSLELMRRELLSREHPDAAVFVGGMEGIPREYELFGELRPGRPRYALASPGGAAARLPSALHGVVYPTLARRILNELEQG